MGAANEERAKRPRKLEEGEGILGVAGRLSGTVSPWKVGQLVPCPAGKWQSRNSILESLG